VHAFATVQRGPRINLYKTWLSKHNCIGLKTLNDGAWNWKSINIVVYIEFVENNLVVRSRRQNGPSLA